MRRASAIVSVLLASLATGCVGTTSAMPPNSEKMPTSHQIVAEPSGFASFCLRFADQCTVRPGANAEIALDNSTWILLNAVNTSVNRAIWPEDDIKHYGRVDYWTIPTDGYGDCEDYALTKRKDLLQAGLPAQALQLAVVDSPKSGRHAVLTVSTSKGTYVLDNLTSDIRPWHATDYVWIERQDSENPMKWVSLLPTRAEQLHDQPTAAGDGSMVSHGAAGATMSDPVETSVAPYGKQSIDEASKANPTAMAN